MKLKKYSYLLILMLTLIIGINGVYATNALSTNQMVLNYNQKKNNGSSVVLQTINNGKTESEDCEKLFGDKNDDGVNYDPNGDGESSIRYFLNEILMYPKIIVPILVIVLGMFDFGKAVMASKEDEMKKAQTTFIKRVIISVAIFFIPTIIDIIMSLADLVWNGMYPTSCGL